MNFNIKSEIWKDVEGYEGLYQVSNLGRVKSLRREYIDSKNRKRLVNERILKPGVNRAGYLSVLLCKNGDKTRHILHRLVARAFLSNTKNLPQVNHKNEQKDDCRVDNLEWCTPSYNINHGTRNKRVSDALSKEVYCIELKLRFNSLNEAAAYVGCTISNICICLKGKSKTAGKHPITGVRLHWTYA